MLKVVQRKIALTCLVGLCVALGGQAAFAGQADKFLTAVRTSNIPLIDGYPGDRCWKGVEFTEGFTVLSSHKPSRLSTKFKCVYDNKAVYFLFVCEEKKDDLALKAKKHDDPVWFDSCIELFISPDKQPIDMMLQPNGRHYGHLIFNANGVKFDTIGDNAADGWNPKWTVKTEIHDNRWIAEVALPFSMLPKQDWRPYVPSDLTTWKIQIARSNFVGKKVEWTTIFKGFGQYANKSCFGNLVFSTSADKDRIHKQLDWNNNIKPLLSSASKHAKALRDGGHPKEAANISKNVQNFKARFKAIEPKKYPGERSEIVAACGKIESNAKAMRCKMIASSLGQGKDIALTPQPAMKDDAMVLPGFIPAAKKLQKPVDVTLCPDEYEPASFVVWSEKALKNVTVDIGEFRCGKNTLPEDAIDPYWVKCWYQGARYGPTHSGNRVLVPELLLKNSELVKVDFKNRKNIFRHKKNEGDKLKNPYDVTNFPDDAKTLLPIKELPAKFAQQVWLTVRVPKNTPAGTYEGKITVKADNAAASEIPVRIKVLGFELKPSPLISGVYHYVGGWEGPREEAILARMRNLAQHGITNVGVRCEYPEKLPLVVERMRKAGLDTDKVFILTYRYWVDKYANHIHPKKAEELTALWLKYAKKAGVKQLYLYLSDEAQGKRLKVQEKYAPKMREMGAKTWVACYRGYFPTAGKWIDAPVIAGNPVPKILVDMIHKAGNIILCYANPQCGSEMPEIYRRNYGLLLWAANYDGSMNYTYWGGFGDPWDDFDHPFYRDHNMAYPTKSGIVDTVQWEGWREGVDDCRYLATLQASIETAQKQGRTKQAQQAKAWIVKLKTDSGQLRDLAKVRNEMIHHINQCNGIR